MTLHLFNWSCITAYNQAARGAEFVARWTRRGVAHASVNTVLVHLQRTRTMKIPIHQPEQLNRTLHIMDPVVPVTEIAKLDIVRASK